MAPEFGMDCFDTADGVADAGGDGCTGPFGEVARPAGSAAKAVGSAQLGDERVVLNLQASGPLSVGVQLQLQLRAASGAAPGSAMTAIRPA